MSDLLDKASELEELQRNLAIEKARKKEPTLFTGRCRYCNAEIDSGIFCDKWCAEDYESEEIIKKRQFKNR